MCYAHYNEEGVCWALLQKRLYLMGALEDVNRRDGGKKNMRMSVWKYPPTPVCMVGQGTREGRVFKTD